MCSTAGKHAEENVLYVYVLDSCGLGVARWRYSNVYLSSWLLGLSVSRAAVGSRPLPSDEELIKSIWAALMTFCLRAGQASWARKREN